jgi:geranylgeranyl diphosphate synthase type 3
MAVMLMSAVASQPSAVKRAKEATMAALCDDLALFFQVQDDLLNLASPKFHETKGFCEDISEGKLSFVVLHAFRRFGEMGLPEHAQELASILRSKTTSREAIKRALALIHVAGSFEYTLSQLKTVQDRISKTIGLLGGNAGLACLVNKLEEGLADCFDIQTRVILS